VGFKHTTIYRCINPYAKISPSLQVVVIILLSANYDILIKASSGTVFHKNPELPLSKEETVPFLLNDYCSNNCTGGARSENHSFREEFP
jgi:hypothetical protein